MVEGTKTSREVRGYLVEPIVYSEAVRNHWIVPLGKLVFWKKSLRPQFRAWICGDRMEVSLYLLILPPRSAHRHLSLLSVLPSVPQAIHTSQLKTQKRSRPSPLKLCFASRCPYKCPKSLIAFTSPCSIRSKVPIQSQHHLYFLGSFKSSHGGFSSSFLKGISSCSHLF